MRLSRSRFLPLTAKLGVRLQLSGHDSAHSHRCFSVEAGFAARKGERKKCNRYNFLKNEFFISGLACETMGSCGPEARRMCSILRNKLIERSGDERALED